jgi:hypothetical protein
VNFEVIGHDANGQPVRCSYCARGAKHVVVLPLTTRPGLDEPFTSPDGTPLWAGLCAHCVLDMAKALADAQGQLPA